MGSYKYLHRFQIINCAECESTDELTVNEYTDEVLFSKHIKVLSKLMNNWVLFVGICFSAVTLKILAEWLVEKMR